MSEMHAYIAPDIIREVVKTTLLDIVDHNLSHNPKPAHMNKDIMTALLQMENRDE